MKEIALKDIAALAALAEPQYVKAGGPLLPTGVAVLEVREAGQLWRVETPCAQQLWWKRYTVPGWKQPLSLLQRSRSRRESRGLILLRQRKLPAPRVCACVEWRRGPLVRESALITHGIPHAIPLNHFLRAEPDAQRRALACASVGTLAAQLHQTGIGHFRFLAKNILVLPGDPSQSWILDAPYLCAWSNPTPKAVRRFDLASICSKAGELELEHSAQIIAAYSRITGEDWRPETLARASRMNLKLRRISLYLGSIWTGHRADRFLHRTQESA